MFNTISHYLGVGNLTGELFINVPYFVYLLLDDSKPRKVSLILSRINSKKKVE